MAANYGALDYYRDSEYALAAAAQDTELVQNLVLESGLYLSEPELIQMRTDRQNAESLNMFSLKLLREAEEDAIPHFKQIARNGNETIDFHIGYQHTREDEAAIIAAGRKPYRFNEFRTIVNVTLGEAVAQRTDWRAVPANERSAARTEIANKSLAWVAQSNKIDNVKADWLRDGLLYGVGVCGVRQHPFDPEGRVQVMRCRPQEFMWDINSATDGSLANTKWLWRATWVDRMQLAAEFPEWRNEILSAAGDFVSTRGYEAEYTMVRPKVKVPVGVRDETGQYNPHARQMFGRLLFKREFYVRRWTKRWIITDPFTGTTFPCNNPDQAARQQQSLEKYYMQTPVWSALGDLRTRIFSAREAQAEVIDQLIFIGDRLVRVNSEMGGDLPYVFYIPEWFNGDVTPYFDHFKDPQRWLNRIMSFVDDLQAGGKGGMVIDEKYKPQDMNSEEFRNSFNEPNWKLSVNSADDSEFDAKKVIAYVQEQHNGQVVSAMIPYIESMMDKMGGGSNRSGSAAFAGQSGKSAEAMRAAGSMLTMSAFDKFRMSEAQLGQRSLYMLQFLHPAAQMRVYDEDMQPQFFSFLDAGIETLADYEFDVTVKEVVASPSEQQARIHRLIDLLGYAPNLAPHVIPFILKNANIDYSERKAIEAGVQQDMENAQRAAEQQYQMEREEMDRKLQVQETGMYLKARAQSWVELNVPKITIAGKASSDPLTQTTMMNWAGIGAGVETHPAMLMAGQAAQALMRQSELTMQQVEEAANTPTWERDAIANKVAVKKNAPSAKDTANRATREVRSGNAQ